MDVRYSIEAYIDFDTVIGDQEYSIHFKVTNYGYVYLVDVRNMRMNHIYTTMYNRKKPITSNKHVIYKDGEPYIRWTTFRFIFDDEPLKAAILRCAKEINPKELFQKFNNIL